MTDGTGDDFDLAVIGGGINGCGIARDAAGRGLKVFLCEQGDLAQATSSASTKLLHGGLRYLEHYEFRLVREALIEREVLLAAMPHIAWPLRFVLPHHKGLRPAWLLRLGLFAYDHLGGRRILPGTRTLNLARDAAGGPLQDSFHKAFEYSDCWVEDARLVVLNARDAADRGAVIAPRTRCLGAIRDKGAWQLTLEDARGGGRREIRAAGLVNAAGPWVEDVIRGTLGTNVPARVRLVRGSHIVVPKLFDHGRAYIFQNTDDRIVFAIPYEEDFTLIGTTDVDHQGAPGEAHCTPAEIDYLCAIVSAYFAAPVRGEDVVWTYSGVRPLFDDGAQSASTATRDYMLQVDDDGGALPALNVFGGKITTYRRLAEAALGKLAPYYPQLGSAWTAAAPLPGGDFPVEGAPALAAALQRAHPFLDDRWARRLVRAYGTQARELLGGAESEEALGRRFGWNLTEREVRWLMDREWAHSAEDVLWRRSKIGLRLDAAERQALADWMAAASSGATAAAE